MVRTHEARRAPPGGDYRNIALESAMKQAHLPARLSQKVIGAIPAAPMPQYSNAFAMFMPD
jgi:hypothetical protein